VVNGSEGWPRVLRPLGLLVLFVAAIRGLPEQTRPAAPEVSCDLAASSRPDVATLERCLELEPDDVELMLELGRVHEQAQQWERAEALYRRALEVDPEDGDAHLRLGEVLLKRGDAMGAAREGAAALKTQPGSRAAQELIRRGQTGVRPQ
jgi:predicted TPR repeat methyltransferase